MKKTKNKQNDLSHLEGSVYFSPPASPQEWTGLMPSLPENSEHSKNLSQLMNVPTSVVTRKKRKK